MLSVLKGMGLFGFAFGCSGEEGLNEFAFPGLQVNRSRQSLVQVLFVVTSLLRAFRLMTAFWLTMRTRLVLMTAER